MTTPADPNATSLPEEVLVHGSPDRTILSRRDPSGDRPPELWKILETGSGLDAEREVSLGQQLAGLGVAEYLEARREDGSGKPVVVMAHHDGQNLEDFVARMGALPARMALGIGARIAEILSRMHRATVPDGPHGIVHGDIKPSNILCDPARIDDPSRLLLLDLEHASAAAPGSEPISGAAAEPSFTGGTVGFAPPEANHGARPTPAFDIYALGATLRVMLSGCHPDRADHGQWGAMPVGVAELLDRCMSHEPADRPSAAHLTIELEQLAEAPQDDLDTVLDLLQAGKVDAAQERWSTTTTPLRESTRGRSLEAWLQRAEDAPEVAPALGPVGRQRDTGTGSPGRPPMAGFAHKIADTVRQLQERLNVFPKCATSLNRRRECRQGAAQVLAELPALLQGFEREADFDAARDLLRAGRDTADAVLSQPGSFAIPGVSPRLLNPLQRSPLQFLERAETRLEDSARDHDHTIQRLGDAEAELDLAAMEEVILTVTREGGGARMAVAALRDRVHRLGFYLDRLSAPMDALDLFAHSQGAAQDPAHSALAPVRQFLQRCASRAPGLLRARSEDTQLDLRRLRRTLEDLHREFSRVDTTEPIEALDRLAEHFTDQAWELVTTAEQQLESVPVPVRPLQSTLNRLDGWRMAGAFVDRPERPRTDLMDAIEAVRLEIERARATRDSIASGAEKAIARGHWTTALYDMERAVENFADDDTSEDGVAESDDDRDELKSRYAEVKRRKAELESAMRRNVDLASRYTAHQDQPDSTTEARLAILEERRSILQQLVEELHEDRAHRYRQDLRDVDVLVVQEHAARAERQLDASDDPVLWTSLARETLALLSSPAARGGTGEAPGRVQRMIDHWEHRLDQAQREVDRRAEIAQDAQPASGSRRYGRWGAIALVGALALVTWQLGPVLAGSRPATNLPQLTDELAGIEAAPLSRLITLAQSLAQRSELLGTTLAERAGNLGEQAAAIAEAEQPEAAVRAFAANLQQFDQSLAEAQDRSPMSTDEVDGLRRFGERAWSLAMVLAERRSTEVAPLRDLPCRVLSPR